MELSPRDKVMAQILQAPEKMGQQVGFKDLTAELHGKWIRKMVRGEGDYTLQAHRGSYKSSCLAVAISLLLIYQPKQNIIFLRKTDNDVSEMLGMVSKILRSEVVRDAVSLMYNGVDLQIVTESQTHLSTNLWTSPMGAPQLLGLGIKSSITGKHAWYVITDDICNKDDRESRAERERTKRQYDELQNIRNRGGRIINLGTPWHKDDVFSKMPNIDQYDCYTTGLIPKEKLEELRQSMAPSLFAANYSVLLRLSPAAVQSVSLSCVPPIGCPVPRLSHRGCPNGNPLFQKSSRHSWDNRTEKIPYARNTRVHGCQASIGMWKH